MKQSKEEVRKINEELKKEKGGGFVKEGWRRSKDGDVQK